MKEVFVSWLHSDDKINSWIPAENILFDFVILNLNKLLKLNF